MAHITTNQTGLVTGAAPTTPAVGTLCSNGGSTQVYSSGGWMHLSPSTSYSTTTNFNAISLPQLRIDGGENPAIRFGGDVIDLKLLARMMKDIQSILLILEDNVALHEEYPTLKDLYDRYRVVEQIVKSDATDD